MAAGISARLTWTPRDGRKFAFPVGAAFLGLAAVAWWRHPHAVPWRVLVALGGLLLVLGATIPGRLEPVHRAWMGFAHALSKVTTPVIMGLVFYLVLTPIALLMRAFGRRPLVRKETAGSFWVAAPSGGRSDLTHQF